jgi:putative transposase
VKRRRHTPEQIIRKLREADRLLAEGREVPKVAKQLEVSEATYHRRRAQCGGLKRTPAVNQLSVLPPPNAPRKRNLRGRGTGRSTEALVIASVVGAGGVEPPSSSVSANHRGTAVRTAVLAGRARP